MVDKILSFLSNYVENIEEVIKRVGKNKTVSIGLNLLIKRNSYEKDALRKEISIYVKRIISVNEFEQLLDYDRAEYVHLLNE